MARTKSTHVDDAVAVGRRLREAREQAGLSQRQLAFEGCSAAYISRVESGGRIPSPAVLRQLASRLRVTESWLAKGQETVTADEQLREAEIALRLDNVELARALYAAVRDDTVDGEARSAALEGLAEIALRVGDPEEAVALAEDALAMTGEQPEDRPSLANCLARAYAASGEIAPAIAVLERCVEHLSSDPLQFVRFSTFLGAALTDGGNFADAERVIASALVRGRELVDPYARARLYWSESRLLQEQGNHAAAEKNALRTLEILRATEDAYAVALILQMLAHIKIDLGEPGEALELLREGWPKILATASPLEVTQYRIEEARALGALGEHQEAAALAVELTKQLGDAHPLDAGRAHLLLAETFEAAGEPARAREMYELAIELLEQRPPSRHLVKAYREYGALLRRDGDDGRALDVFEKALGVQDEVGRPLA
jgi:transcriptional regulator with XRE-family HTH domain